MKIDLIAGARPNFMKISPIIDAIHKAQKDGKDISYRLVHTGQHYDKNMSGSFSQQLGIPMPHANLGAGGGSQAEQTATIMIGYEKLLLEERTDLCLVVGDVTIAQIRQNIIPPRSFDVTFADRYSLCAINADKYINEKSPERIARAFYNL